MARTRYQITYDPNIPDVLPPFVAGTEELLAIPRADRFLPAVKVPKGQGRGFPVLSTITGGFDGGHFEVEDGDYHVDPSVHFSVSRLDVGPSAVYRLTNEQPDSRHPGTRHLKNAWRNTIAEVVALRRIQPAEVLGQIAPEAVVGGVVGRIFIGGNITFYHTFAGAWLIRDPSGRNYRVATTEELTTMFSSLSHTGPNGGIHTQLLAAS